MNKKSSKYNFIKMMWYLRKVNKEFLENQVIKEAITQEEMDEVLNSPQIGD